MLTEFSCLKFTLFLVCLYQLMGCTMIPRPLEPIEFTVYHPGSGKEMLLILPGLGDSPKDFNKHGFINVLRKCNPDLGIISANAHLGYYVTDSITERLYQDIIYKAQQKGIQKIWIAGISLGGLGSLLMLMKYNEIFSGGIVLAPFLGEKSAIKSLLKTTDIKQWEPDSNNEFQKFWQQLIQAQNSGALPEITLGTGTSDRYIAIQRKFSDLIGHDNSVFVSGPHNWETWKTLWQKIVPQHPVCKG